MWQRKNIGNEGWLLRDKGRYMEGCGHVGRCGLMALKVWRRDCGPRISCSLHCACFWVLLLTPCFALVMMCPKYIMNFPGLCLFRKLGLKGFTGDWHTVALGGFGLKLSVVLPPKSLLFAHFMKT